MFLDFCFYVLGGGRWKFLGGGLVGVVYVFLVIIWEMIVEEGVMVWIVCIRGWVVMVVLESMVLMLIWLLGLRGVGKLGGIFGVLRDCCGDD